jgi:hypothetical protein
VAEEADESTCKVVALCANVEVIKHEGAIGRGRRSCAEDGGGRRSCCRVAMSMELQAHKGRHGDDGDVSRQSSWEGAMPNSMQSGLSET